MVLNVILGTIGKEMNPRAKITRKRTMTLSRARFLFPGNRAAKVRRTGARSNGLKFGHFGC